MLTVYGIETNFQCFCFIKATNTLQQCLPFTVLKLTLLTDEVVDYWKVATVLTVYGIETRLLPYEMYEMLMLQQCLPFTVLKQYFNKYYMCHDF